MSTPAPFSPSLFHRIAVVTAVALSTLLVIMCIALLCIMPGCGPSAGQVKPILRTVDQHVQLACQGLAQALAERSGADAQRIIATTCAVEGITRTMRELLLSVQINQAQRAGVAVPDVSSASLEADPYPPGEAAAE
jgi:hypothetical protein